MFYLDNGGSAAVDFLDNCRKMARSYEQLQEILDPEELGLPDYVVQTFQFYMEDKLEFARGKQIRPWRLYLDPYGPDFYLHLPAQLVEGSQAAARYHWKISMHILPAREIVHQEVVRVRRKGVNIQTEESQIPLEYLAHHLDVYFVQEDKSENDKGKPKILRAWRRQILPGSKKPPIVAFRYSDQQYCNWNQYLPGEALWLIYPAGAELRIEGEGSFIESGAEMVDPWTGWQLKAWDLSTATAVRLVKDGTEISVPIPIQTQIAEPVLLGENSLSQNMDPDGTQVYIGDPPVLQIPLRPGRSLEQEIAHWEISIESRWAAKPVMNGEKHCLSEYSKTILQDGQNIHLPLKEILGEKVYGTFKVDAFGPLGMEKSFRFRSWPMLGIEGLEPYYIPSKDGPVSAHFSIQVENDCEVQAQAGSSGVAVSNKSGKWEVSVTPDSTFADLHLVFHHQNEVVRVPLFISIPRLSWSLPQGVEDTDIQWTTSPIQMSVDALLQSTHKSLYLSLPIHSKTAMMVTILLVDPETDAIKQRSSTQESHPGQTHWRFKLGDFSTTLNELIEYPNFEFRLEILDFENDQQWLVPLLKLSRKLDIKNVSIDLLSPSEIRIRWEEPKPLRNRRVLIWSKWQPWIDPYEIKIPDNARGELLVSNIDLPPSYYRLQFFTAPLWEETKPPPLPPADSHLVKAASPEKMLQWVNGLIKSNPDYFLSHFYKACILEALTDDVQMDEEIQWCYQNIHNAGPKSILSFYQWLGWNQAGSGELRDINTQKAVRISMFRSSNLEKLLCTYDKEHQVRQDYLSEYLNTSLIQPDSALLILDYDDDPARIIHSLQIMVKRQHPEALPRIVRLIENGELSDADAEDILSQDPDYIFPLLADLPQNPVTNRLIKRLSERFPDQQYFVIRNQWVRTVAGWGRIDSIQDENGQELPHLNRHSTKPLIILTLRPEQFPEVIQLDLQNKTIQFKDAVGVYRCTKESCFGFISSNLEILRRDHNRAAHMGLGPAFQSEKPQIRYFKDIQLSIDPPENALE
jgi:hypothetical protein